MLRTVLLALALAAAPPARAQERTTSFGIGPELTWDALGYTPYSWFWEGDNHYPGNSMCVGGQAFALVGLPRVGIDGRWCIDPWYVDVQHTWSLGAHAGALVPVVSGHASGGDIGVGYQRFSSDQMSTFIGDYVYVRFAARYVLPFEFLALEFAGTWQMNFPARQVVDDEQVAFGSYFQPGLRISVIFGRLAPLLPPPPPPPEPEPVPDEPPPLAIPQSP